MVKAGDSLIFKGCCWDEGWDFDAPLIIYSPFKRYCFTGSLCEAAIEAKVEDLCIDLVLGLPYGKKWSDDTIEEFKWRGWSTRFNRRKKAIHHSVKVDFFLNKDNELDFEMDI